MHGSTWKQALKGVCMGSLKYQRRTLKHTANGSNPFSTRYSVDWFILCPGQARKDFHFWMAQSLCSTNVAHLAFQGSLYPVLVTDRQQSDIKISRMLNTLALSFRYAPYCKPTAQFVHQALDESLTQGRSTSGSGPKL
mmetsp:Transcript_10613/g.65449  ORF Transcript_10613/g.65449 Transcript_10613/m.65449 type:complete len:138 (+) Transcript_10613:2270-2683(+)